MFNRRLPLPDAASGLGGNPAVMLAALRSSGNGMTMVQVRTLLTLATDGPQTLSSVAEHLHLHESTIDATLCELVARGFVVQIPTASGAGVSIVALSIGGRRRVDDAIRRHPRPPAPRQASTLQGVPPE